MYNLFRFYFISKVYTIVVVLEADTFIRWDRYIVV